MKTVCTQPPRRITYDVNKNEEQLNLASETR